jgi:hypothetical protein
MTTLAREICLGCESWKRERGGDEHKTEHYDGEGAKIHNNLIWTLSEQVNR